MIPHRSNRIWLADTIEITFRIQKNGVVEDQILQWATIDKDLCPVKFWADTISRLQSYPNYSPEWPVYYYFDFATNKATCISSSEIFDDIKAAVDAIGEDILGFTSKDVGTHSNRSGFAMMMYLGGESVFKIMLIGRWLSNAFLRYIEKQVREFSLGASQKMFKYDTFYNIPVRPRTNTDTEHSQSAEAYCRPIHRHIFGLGGSVRDQLRPSMNELAMD